MSEMESKGQFLAHRDLDLLVIWRHINLKNAKTHQHVMRKKLVRYKII